MATIVGMFFSITKINVIVNGGQFYIKKVLNYTEFVGKLKPEMYKISNDSFFSSDYNGKMRFKGKLENVNESNFDLVYQSQVITFHKVKEGVTFKDVILKKLL